jgi:hypothetical protein
MPSRHIVRILENPSFHDVADAIDDILRYNKRLHEKKDHDDVLIGVEKMFRSWTVAKSMLSQLQHTFSKLYAFQGLNRQERLSLLQNQLLRHEYYAEKDPTFAIWLSLHNLSVKRYTLLILLLESLTMQEDIASSIRHLFHDDRRTEDCIICFETLGKAWTSLSCQHLFHDYCLDEWLQRAKSCPICRSHV